MSSTYTTIYVNILMNKENTVENIEVIRLKVTRQNLKIDSRKFRETLIFKGLGHSFWKGWLWIIPVNGRSVSQLSENINLEEFGINLKEAELYCISNFDDDNLWFSVGVVLMRDAIKYSLRQTLKGRKNIKLVGLKFYDLNHVISKGLTTYVVAGLSLQRILRIDGNIGISPMLRLELLDTFNEIVKDN